MLLLLLMIGSYKEKIHDDLSAIQFVCTFMKVGHLVSIIYVQK